MDLEIKFTAVLKEEHWDWDDLLSDGKLDEKAKQKITEALANLHLSYKKCAVEIRPHEADKALPLHSVVFSEERAECVHPRHEREYIGRNTIKCKLCGHEFE